MKLPMQRYLGEMRDEFTATLDRLWREHREVEDIQQRIDTARAEMTRNYARIESMIADPYMDDDEGIATGLYWETYFGADKIQHDLTKTREQLETDLKEHSIARANAAGSILQYAKQAISQCHGKQRSKAPVGRREIAGEPLRNIIWEGRNQSEHWDEATFSVSVDAVFAALEKQYPGRFADYKTRKNKAFDIIDILGWRDYATVEADLLSLA